MTTVRDLQLPLPIDQLTLSGEEHDVNLPPEVWEQIFGNLRGKYLLTVRLVCHRWKAIVDGSRSLWNGLRITRLATEFAPVPFSNLNLRLEKFEFVNSWWRRCGDRLTCFSLRESQLALKTFVGMLRHCPNLGSLCLRWMKFTGEPVEVDFQLAKLKELELRGVDNGYDVCAQICPRLRKLVLLPAKRDDQVSRGGVRLIRSVQRTLESLKFRPYKKMLQEMARMEYLRLKRVHFYNSHEQNAIELVTGFCCSQPLLEEIIIRKRILVIDNWSLTAIGQSLPHLKHLDARIDMVASILPSFLDAMSHLEKLNLLAYDGGDHLTLNLDGVKCPNLTELSLVLFSIKHRNLNSFLNESKNLAVLSLSECMLDECAGFFDMIGDHPKLYHFELSYSSTPIPQPRNVLPCRVNKLRYLEIKNLQGITVQQLVQIAKLSPHLEQLVLWAMVTVDDLTVERMCRHLARLQRLTVGCCPLTVACAGPILEHCPELHYLKIPFFEEADRLVFREVFGKLARDRRRHIELKVW